MKDECAINFKERDDTLLFPFKEQLVPIFPVFGFFVLKFYWLFDWANVISYPCYWSYFISFLSAHQHTFFWTTENQLSSFPSLKCEDFKSFHNCPLSRENQTKGCYFPTKCSLVIFFIVFANDATGTEGGNECIAQESLFCDLGRSRRKTVPESFSYVFNFFLLVFLLGEWLISGERKQVLQSLSPELEDLMATIVSALQCKQLSGLWIDAVVGSPLLFQYQ